MQNTVTGGGGARTSETTAHHSMGMAATHRPHEHTSAISDALLISNDIILLAILVKFEGFNRLRMLEAALDTPSSSLLPREDES